MAQSPISVEVFSGPVNAIGTDNSNISDNAVFDLIVMAAAPPPTPLSPDGSIIHGGQPGGLTTSEGSWPFGAGAGGSDTVDRQALLNGEETGFLASTQISNGQLYGLNQATGNW